MDPTYIVCLLPGSPGDPPMTALLSVALAAFLAAPAAGPWSVTLREVVEQTPDGHVDLQVAVPVLAGDARPAVRDALNQALWKASNADKLQGEAADCRSRHEARLAAGAGEELPVDSPYHCGVACEVGTAGPERVSVCFKAGGYAFGMATGFTYWKGCTFDAQTGEPLDLPGLLGPGWRDRLEPLLKEYLRPGAKDYFQDWEARLDKAEPGFYLRPASMVVFFQKYELAAGVMGVVSVEIPLARLGTLVVPN
jgi:hypothetical protein